MKKLKLILVEDHLLVRKGIRSVINEDDRFDIIGEYGDAESLIDNLENEMPNLIFMDISLPGMNGMRATGKIKSMHPEVRVVILSMFTEIEYIQQCLDFDVSGYLVKGSTTNDFKMALDAFYDNKSFFSGEIHQKVVDSYRNIKKNIKVKKDVKITSREQEILNNLVNGLTNSQIADVLFISERTVEAHRANIMKKMQANNAAELITKAFRLGLVK
jgi:DNA-binding NarL/FixJ family response regulator